jgi:pseudaminic acid biosynthesis-associated methylase
MEFYTDQEKFWAGEFGDQYIERNNSENLHASNLRFFSRALKGIHDAHSCIEFGANIGMNIKALKLLLPRINAYAIEINTEAAKQLKEVIPVNNIFNESILSFSPAQKWDLVVIKGVLIHINPKMLNKAYEKLYASCERYLLIAEYYNPSPLSISYRGYSERLFKRDFAGEIMDIYPNLRLIDYGFAYHRDPNFPQDDISWFLLEKI